MTDFEKIYERARKLDDTKERIEFMTRSGMPLPDLDNYHGEPDSDPDFEKNMHRWLFLFQCTDGPERAAAIMVAIELFKDSKLRIKYGVNFYSMSFSDDTRNAYYAKAMCILHREMN